MSISFGQQVAQLFSTSIVLNHHKLGILGTHLGGESSQNSDTPCYYGDSYICEKDSILGVENPKMVLW